MKKGFTLTELLAVIVILSILTIIAIPTYQKIAEDVRKSNLETMKSIISSTMLGYANKYLIDEIKPANKNCTDGCCKYYSVEYIVNNNIYVTTKEKNIINPVTNQKLEGYIKVSYNIDKYQLESEYIENIPNNCDNGE